MKVAEYLLEHPKVEKVNHPGEAFVHQTLISNRTIADVICYTTIQILGFKFHPEHELAKRQTSGHCGVVSFYIKNGTLEDSKTFLKSLKYFNLAVSLGSFESLVELPLV